MEKIKTKTEKKCKNLNRKTSKHRQTEKTKRDIGRERERNTNIETERVIMGDKRKYR